MNMNNRSAHPPMTPGAWPETDDVIADLRDGMETVCDPTQENWGPNKYRQEMEAVREKIVNNFGLGFLDTDEYEEFDQDVVHSISQKTGVPSGMVAEFGIWKESNCGE